MGSQQIDAQTFGTYDTEDPSFEIDSVVYRTQVYPLLRADGFGNEQLPITVVYGHPDIGYDSDLLDGFRFAGGATSPENSSKAQTVEVKGTFLQLYVGNERKTINQRDLTATSPTSQF